MNFYKKKKIENWHLIKPYLHFDLPLSFKKASETVKNPNKIATHPFLPFITFNVESIKYVYDEDEEKKKQVIKKRPICYSSHLDGYIYNYYANILSKKYEEKLKNHCLEENILAFRKLGKSNIHFAKKAFDDIKELGVCTVIALDFSKFFQTLNHKILHKQWCKILDTEKLPNDHYNIFKSLTKYSQVNKNEVYELFGISKHNPQSKFKSKKNRICSIKDFRNLVRKENSLIEVNPNYDKNMGIPQGSSLSALLSNIYMIDFDIQMKEYINELNGKYYRYCDDMLIVAPWGKAKEIEIFATDAVEKLKVTINTEKTEIRDFLWDNKNNRLIVEKPLQYLGFLFDGKNIYIRSSSISRFYYKMKRGIRLANKTKQKRNQIRESKNHSTKKLYKKKIYERYHHLGKSNFIRYGLRARKIMDESKSLKKQHKHFLNRVESIIK